MKSLIKKVFIYFFKNYILLAHTLLLFIPFQLFNNTSTFYIATFVVSPLASLVFLCTELTGINECILAFPMWILAFYLDRLKNKLYYKWKEKKLSSKSINNI